MIGLAKGLSIAQLTISKVPSRVIIEGTVYYRYKCEFDDAAIENMIQKSGRKRKTGSWLRNKCQSPCGKSDE